MEYSGPGTIADVEADLALTDDEDIADEPWPPLALHPQSHGSTPWQSHVPLPAALPPTTTK